MNMILGFDPGRDKCGLAVMGSDRQIYDHQVVPAIAALTVITSLCAKFPISLIVMGDQTTGKEWKQKVMEILPTLPIVMIDERYSSLEARDRYWQMYPPTGWSALIPQEMRLPPGPIDDIVAIVLIERYLQKS